jgi:hypothetical protein
MEKKPRIILLFLFGISLTNILAQNLVPNPGFESYHCKHWFLSSLENCNSWTSLQSPDYFNTTCTQFKTVAIPDTDWWGPQLPKEGNAYAGIIAYRPNGKSIEKALAEYLLTELTTPLMAGITYQVEMSVSLAECSGLAVPLSVYFTKERVKGNVSPVLAYAPQVNFKLVNDTAKWITLQQAFVARGGEKYLVVGCFAPQRKAKTHRVEPSKAIRSPRGEAYYFIDAVSVSKMGTLSNTVIFK